MKGLGRRVGGRPGRPRCPPCGSAVLVGVTGPRQTRGPGTVGSALPECGEVSPADEVRVPGNWSPPLGAGAACPPWRPLVGEGSGPASGAGMLSSILLQRQGEDLSVGAAGARVHWVVPGDRRAGVEETGWRPPAPGPQHSTLAPGPPARRSGEAAAHVLHSAQAKGLIEQCLNVIMEELN